MTKLRLSFVMLMLSACLGSWGQTISLQGEWDFGYQDNKLNEKILMPGSMTERMKGNDISIHTKWVGSIYDSSYYFNPYMAKYRVKENMKIPFFLTPAKHYVGKAYYRKLVDIPSAWKNKHIVLFLERPHIVTTLRVNGQEVGSQNSLSTPHQYDITDFAHVGENEILICVDNNPDLVGVGYDSHSVTDQTQGDWNGIVGKIELRATPKTFISQLDVFPNVKEQNVMVKIKVSGKHIKKTKVVLQIGNRQLKAKGDSIITATIPMNDCQLWDEYHPTLYTLTATLDNGDSKSVVFGMREIEIKGKSFYVNGNKTMMRGTVENCCFPNTGYPPTDKAEWIKVLSKCKEYGLNHIRFHSYCPPEAAFEAADEMGFYLQPEGPSWPNHGVSLGRGEFIDKYLMEETQRMVRDYGNHPSFCMLAAGNEPRGNWVKWCSDFVDYWKATDSRRVYTGASVGGSWQWQPKNQYHVKAGARGLTWDRRQPNSSDDYSRETASFYDKATRKTFQINEPFIAHEMGQWCAFPDFNEIPQYTGAYKAKNFEIFRDLLNDNGMGSLDRKFLESSGKLQMLCYKHEIERLRRTQDYAGYQLLSINDYSGQGSALVGVLNVYFREKGYCDAKQFREFCSPTVILARFPKFTFQNDEEFSVPIEVSNMSDKDLSNNGYQCIVTDETGKKYHHIMSDGINAPKGTTTQLGKVSLDLKQFDKPTHLTLKLIFGTSTENHYDFWVYPAEAPMMEANDVHITDTLDDKAIQTLKAGGKVLLSAAGKIRYGKDIAQQYLPVFWNTSWFKMRPPHTTGAYINKVHPVFKDFPTDDWTNLNWWELTNKQQVMQFTEFPKDFQPIVQSIDTWFVSRKIGMLFEANVFNGKLLMTSIDISSNLDRRIVARQLRKSMLNYMQSDEFKPQHTIDVQLIKNLFEKDAPILDMYTKDSPDELKPKIQ